MTISRRQFSSGLVAAVTGSPLLAQIAKPMGGPVPPISASTRLLHQSASQVYKELKANAPNAEHINLLAGQLSMLSASMADDGSLAKTQALWHPQSLVWTAQDTANLIASAAVAGIAVDPALFNGIDQQIQNKRDSFPAQVSDALTSLSTHLLKTAAKIQVGLSPARIALGGSIYYPHRIYPQVSCPYGSGTISLITAALAASLAAAGFSFIAAAIAAAAAIERMLDSFSNCDDQLG